MFSDAQIPLYPMPPLYPMLPLYRMIGDFVGVSALDALDPCRDRFRIGTDVISTLPVGPLEGHVTIELAIDLAVSANDPAPR
ncbi:hypothetical protein [Mesorhizobium escarrei]|uniref:Uncharacterized protein n=1 Tax=Mesorhizobium escarrei TaxID=666018 RepID=A0ABN8KJ92_9HYPH|nr:hypothetical protein [Mesorhizobium escarrei]CAH2408835.1 conserved hypothetical protein [Mesorhizobium escarrei]